MKKEGGAKKRREKKNPAHIPEIIPHRCEESTLNKPK